jgi:hypothetical protein
VCLNAKTKRPPPGAGQPFNTWTIFLLGADMYMSTHMPKAPIVAGKLTQRHGGRLERVELDDLDFGIAGAPRPMCWQNAGSLFEDR